MQKKTLLFLVLLLPCLIQAAGDLMRFRVYLKDKPAAAAARYAEPGLSGQLQSGVNLFMPVLSPASMLRRQAQAIEPDSTDYPVSENYLTMIRDKGFPIVTQSRWMNTIVVSAQDSSCRDTLLSLPFVKLVQLVWKNPSEKSGAAEKMAATKNKFEADLSNLYGKADAQLNMLNLPVLNDDGHRGANKMIAVLDAGFCGADTMSWFKNMALVAAKDFIYPPTSIYSGHAHGTSVLSTLAAKEEYIFVGAAPEAKYCLLRSEDVLSEFPIEEDYWVAAAEFADSIGADIITSSLGYTEFDLPELSYLKDQLDGKTAFITRAAAIAATKGMLVICSAGNDGGKPWKKVGFPADAEDVLTVGAVQSNMEIAPFSSVGPTADGRIKPDVMALGANVYLVNGNGVLTTGSGTSFSTPLVAGMAACLWEAFPQLKASELRQYIKESGNRASNPDTLYGYGVPNVQKIMFTLSESFPMQKSSGYYCYPNPVKDKLYFAGLSTLEEPVNVSVYNTLGQKLMERELTGSHSFIDISGLPDSVYLINILVSGDRQKCQKILIHH